MLPTSCRITKRLELVRCEFMQGAAVPLQYNDQPATHCGGMGMFDTPVIRVENNGTVVEHAVPPQGLTRQTGWIKALTHCPGLLRRAEKTVSL